MNAIRMCGCCGGMVYKKGHVIECSQCGAIGDLVTGIMIPAIQLKKQRK